MTLAAVPVIYASSKLWKHLWGLPLDFDTPFDDTLRLGSDEIFESLTARGKSLQQNNLQKRVCRKEPSL